MREERHLLGGSFEDEDEESELHARTSAEGCQRARPAAAVGLLLLVAILSKSGFSLARNQTKIPAAGAEAPQGLREETTSHITIKTGITKTGDSSSRVIEPASDFSSLEWALAIDGKDADKGKYAYGQHFDRVIDTVLPWVLERSRGTCEKVSMDLVDHIRQLCCHGWNFRPESFKPVRGHGIPCFRKMGCKAVQAAIKDIPPELMVVEPASNNSHGRCEQVAMIKQQKTKKGIKQELEHLIKRYNDRLGLIQSKSTLSTAALQDAKLEALAEFLRSFAWLHPWVNGNGRTRTLLLQHQLRCLGLGLGAFMYNNNRDIFFIDKATYVGKIREGIRIASIASKKPSRGNPWVDRDRVKEHLQMFPPPANGSCFKCHCGWGSTE